MADRYTYLSDEARKTLSRIAEWTNKAKSHLYRALDSMILDIQTWVNAQGFLKNVVEDTTPELGGNLDVNDNTITSDSGDVHIDARTVGFGMYAQSQDYIDLEITGSEDNAVIDLNHQGTGSNISIDVHCPNGTVDVDGTTINLDSTSELNLNGLQWPQTDGTATYVLQTDGAGTLSWVANAGGGGGTFVSLSDTPANFTSSGTYLVRVNAGETALEFVADNYLENLSEDTTPQLGGNLDVNGNSIVSAAAGDINITPDTTGSIVLDGLSWPQSDGSANQVLETDGAGQLGWVANAGSGIANVVDDTTPQLGGSLDVNGQKIVSVINGNIDIEPHGTGNVLLGNFTFDADQTVGAGQDNYVLTYDNGTGLISLEASAGGAGTFLGLSDTPGSFAGSADEWVKVNAGATALEFVTSPVTSISTTLPLTKSGTTSVTLDINNATTSTDGAMSSSDKTKLNGIESGADVTDATNVAAAGAVMDGDFSTNGLMTRTGAGTYASRTITGGNEITVTNGDGASGNPTIAFDRTITVSTLAPSGGSDGDLWIRYV